MGRGHGGRRSGVGVVLSRQRMLGRGGRICERLPRCRGSVPDGSAENGDHGEEDEENDKDDECFFHL